MGAAVFLRHLLEEPPLLQMRVHENIGRVVHGPGRNAGLLKEKSLIFSLDDLRL